MPTEPPQDSPNTPEPRKRKSGIISSILLLSRALLRDQSARRNLMMWTIMTAVVMLFIGWTFLDTWLRQNTLLFVVFWFSCAFLTFLSALLAVFDMLLQISLGRARGKRLRREILAKELEAIQAEMLQRAEEKRRNPPEESQEK